MTGKRPRSAALYRLLYCSFITLKHNNSVRIRLPAEWCTVRHMSTAVQLHTKEEEEKKKAVSWAEQWAWKEGEEEKTQQSNRLAWKAKRSAELKKATATRNRKNKEAEQQEDDYFEGEKQTIKWIFDILKERRCAK